ncbi:hypothetical protein HRbin33_01379 [bacterium HR33]|nr:hypothetical protein HRbin33_01379 [bacterium HR33]
MAITLFHRTTIGEARSIVSQGWVDRTWDLGLQDVHTGEDLALTGVWLCSRPLDTEDDDVLHGDALLEVTVDADEEELRPFELEGFFHDARFWVVSADFLNARSRTRIARVDPRSSWGYRAWPRGQDEEQQ